MARKTGKTLTAAERKVRDSSVAAGKASKFVELASKRMNKALKAISQLSNLANRANYSYTVNQVDAMVKALRVEIQSVEDAFKTKDKATVGGFEFK